ncbi:MAG: hypothetical protein U0T02_08365 [Solirubrobacteraceae bacterium]
MAASDGTLFDDSELHGELAARAPVLARPWWLTAGGQRSSYPAERTVVPAERRGEVDELHAAAIHDLVRAAARARDEGDAAAARRFAQAAARLCQETVGLWASVALVEER